MKYTELKSLEHFFKNVTIFLGYYDWKIYFSYDCGNYCWISNELICICLRYSGDIKEIILHEIAHIDTANYCNQKHNPAFWKKMEYLVQRFLKTDLSSDQKAHKKHMSEGYFRVIYKTKYHGKNKRSTHPVPSRKSKGFNIGRVAGRAC